MLLSATRYKHSVLHPKGKEIFQELTSSLISSLLNVTDATATRVLELQDSTTLISESLNEAMQTQVELKRTLCKTKSKGSLILVQLMSQFEETQKQFSELEKIASETQVQYLLVLFLTSV